MEVWENEKCCGNTSRRRMFLQLFRVLPNLHVYFYNSIETRRKYFLFLLENSSRKITENEENFIVLFVDSLRHAIFTSYLINQLRNRKHFPCFYRVIETRVEVWENEKCCGNTSRRRMFLQLFRVLPNLHVYFYNSIETRRKYFLFLLENSSRKITENEENFIVLFVDSLRHAIFTSYLINQLRNRKHFPCFYRVIEKRLLTNQRAYFP